MSNAAVFKLIVPSGDVKEALFSEGTIEVGVSDDG